MNQDDRTNMNIINDISEINSDINNLDKQKNNFSALIYSYNDCLFICHKCRITPIIKFKNNNIDEIFQTCICGERKLFNESEEIQENEKNNISEIDNKNEYFDKDIICSKHNEIFSFYCDKCKIDLCKICHNQHNDHTIIEFDKDNLEVGRKIAYLIDIFELNLNYEVKDLFDIDFNEKDKLIHLISMIINHYYNYPNYNIIRNINNIYDSLSSFIKTHPKDNNLKNFLNVNSPSEFNELSKNEENRSMIKRIIIIGMNFYNLEIFFGIELEKLIILDLRRNNIKNISWLANATLLSLKKLDLGMNELGDDMIKSIEAFKFPELTYLNFYNNYFSDYQIFKAVENSHFRELKFLSVSSNRFNYDISSIDINNIKFNLCTLEKICFNNGVFSDASSKLLTCFDFSSAKIIFLTSNRVKVIIVTS